MQTLQTTLLPNICALSGLFPVRKRRKNRCRQFKMKIYVPESVMNISFYIEAFYHHLLRLISNIILSTSMWRVNYYFLLLLFFYYYSFREWLTPPSLKIIRLSYSLCSLPSPPRRSIIELKKCPSKLIIKRIFSKWIFPPAEQKITGIKWTNTVRH